MAYIGYIAKEMIPPDDRAIHDICVTTAYFTFVNRIADGLGVELESRNA